METAISRSAAPAVEKGFSFVYPRFARLQGYQGRVTLRVRVAPDGRVMTVDLEHSSGYDILDQSAMRQMKSVPFLPALDGQGYPIETVVIQSVNFTIKGTASGALDG
jgi:protein TonB